MAVDTQTWVDQTTDLVHWARQQLKRVSWSGLDRRGQFAAACLWIAVEHGYTIALLISEDLHASALALMRLDFEAYVRGMWLKHAASPAALDRAQEDSFPAIGSMIKALEQPNHLGERGLSQVMEGWGWLNSLTHTGYAQIGARLGGTGENSAFPQDIVLGAFGWGAMFAVLALGGLADLTGNAVLAGEVSARADQARENVRQPA